jgi:hypothetical protein
MKVYAWIENDKLFYTVKKDLAPNNAVEFNINFYDDLILDNGVIRKKTDEDRLKSVKQQMLNFLSLSTKAYIYNKYPEEKQRSDLLDKENAERFLAHNGVDIQSVKHDITNFLLSGTNFTDALNTLTKKYITADAYWLKQLLKAEYRLHFIAQVKQEYEAIKQIILNATSLPLPDIEFKTKFPEVE